MWLKFISKKTLKFLKSLIEVHAIQWPTEKEQHKQWSKQTLLRNLTTEQHEHHKQPGLTKVYRDSIQLLTDFVCLYNYEFWLSLCKIVRSSVILLLPLFPAQPLAPIVLLLKSCVMKIVLNTIIRDKYK